MKFHKSIYFLVFFFCFSSNEIQAQKIVMGSYNLRFDNPKDIGNLWKDRVSPVAALIQYHDFDVLGTQEGLYHQLEDLLKLMPTYAYYGIGRDDGKKDGEYSAIFFKKDKYSLLASGNFWLSATPEIPAVGWDANQTRICTWIKLKEKKSGKQFFVFNAHYDHMGVLARVESSKLVLEKIKSIAAGAPAIYTGDLNGDRESEWYTHLKNSDLLEDAFSNATRVYALNGSFNSFSPVGLNSNRVIDHIFITAHFKANTWAILTDTYNGKYPSDHFPVISELDFMNPKK